MAQRHHPREPKFRDAIERWRFWKDAAEWYPDGDLPTKPTELANAEFLLGVGERFGQLPSAVLAEPASILYLLELEALGGSREQPTYSEEP